MPRPAFDEGERGEELACVYVSRRAICVPRSCRG